jgi:multidrug resistance efflux pump
VSTPFHRTLRSLDADRFRPTLVALGCAAALIVVWLAWFLSARVPVLAVSTRARLESAGAAHPVEAPALGRIVSSKLRLGLEVQAGDVLVELDAEPERLRLEEERRQRSTIAPQIEALRAEMAGEERALAEDLAAARATLDEARAKAREAEALATLGEQEAARAEALRQSGTLSELDALRAATEANRSRAAAESLRLAVERLARELGARSEDRRARIDALRRQASELEGRAATAAATLDRLEHDLDRRRIRATISGRIGEVTELRAGAVVEEGDRLAVIVPDGGVRIVAQLAPQTALGRVRTGQPARFRLTGFPWTEFGALGATVTAIASELDEGLVRVELAVDPATTTRIPLEHGLPGVVEIEVERASPAALVLRAAGRRLDGPATSPAGTGG